MTALAATVVPAILAGLAWAWHTALHADTARAETARLAALKP